MSRKTTRRRRAGTNRRTANQKSGGWGGRLVFVLIAGALVYAFFAVPVRGHTPWQHAQRLVSSEVVVVKEAAKGKGLSEFQKPESVKAAANGKGKPGDGAANGPEKNHDKLTGKDQKELDDLINQKIKK